MILDFSVNFFSMCMMFVIAWISGPCKHSFTTVVQNYLRQYCTLTISPVYRVIISMLSGHLSNQQVGLYTFQLYMLECAH